METDDITPKAAPPKIWKNLGIRFISAVLLLAICVAPFYFGGWVWAALVALLGGRLIYEWVRMADKTASQLAFAIPVIGFLIGIVYTVQDHPFFAALAVLVTALLAGVERMRRGGTAWSVFGVFYIIVPSLLIIALRGNIPGFDTDGFKLLLFIILVVAAADVGAYFGGSALKGPKLAPKLSPNKTWSGFFSGVLLAVLMALIFALAVDMRPVYAALLAVPLILLSVSGDLFESGIKRKLDVKDTGTLMPGHGGLLDRLDSLMAAVLGAAIILSIFPNIWHS